MEYLADHAEGGGGLTFGPHANLLDAYIGTTNVVQVAILKCAQLVGNACARAK